MKRRAGHPAGWTSARRIALACATLAIIAAGAALFDLRDEYRVWRYRTAADTQDLAILRDDRATIEAGDPGHATTPRSLLYKAMMLAHASRFERDDARRRLFTAKAMEAITQAERGRPDWGKARLAEAYIASLDDDPSNVPRVLAALSDSYRLAPYLADAGAWRVATGFAHWPALSSATRTRLIEEAVWLGRDSAILKPKIFDAARASAGYEAFGTLWFKSRQDDADLIMARHRAAP